MHFLSRVFQRFVWFALGVLIVWFFVTRVFATLDEQLPMFVALLLAYMVPLYVVLPLFINIGVTLLRRGRIPRMTRAGDGLVADPVNLLFEATAPELIHAFRNAGWHETDPLTIKTGFKLVVCFVLNKPYPQAPFSPLFLFGRKQDYGFELAIGNSPRKRHHVRFWAANVDPRIGLRDVRYWITRHDVDLTEPITWVGAASRDIGFGFTPLTYRATHKVDADVDDERDFILEALRRCNAIVEERTIEVDEVVSDAYISDGKITWARVAPSMQAPLTYRNASSK